jgi:GntR family transcriptional regulator
VEARAASPRTGFRVLPTVYGAEGRPLEVQDSVAAADRHEFRYEVDMR